MFFVKSRKVLTRRESIRLHVLPTLAVFLVFLIIVGINWFNARSTLRDEENKALNEISTDIEDDITRRFNTYEEILHGGVALFNASENVNREEWTTLSDTFDLQNQYPGIIGIGFIQVVTETEKTTHTRTVRASGVREYSINPAGTRKEYAPLQYFAPSANNIPARVGFDMYSETTRRQAMFEARDTNSPILSSALDLLPTQPDSQPTEGFFLYLPVYRKKAALATIEQRRAALIGYVFGAFRTENLKSFLSFDDNQKLNLKIIDKKNRADRLLYEINRLPGSKEDTLYRESEVRFYGTTWALQYHVSRDVIPEVIRRRQASVLFGGLLFDIFLTAMILLLLLRRSHSLKLKEEHEIQAAKDELLSLAGHQLRTPATGVKQYVGMVLDGYAGKISVKQKNILRKAYNSNERQLGIINQLLSVAKANSGSLQLDKKRTNLSALVKSVFDEQASEFKSKNQKVNLAMPKRPVYVTADEQYLRMALENLVNNASKYTPEKGHIRIGVIDRKAKVCVTVKDNGVGIPEQAQESLFQKFSRIPNELSRQTSGSGVGLYLSKHVALLHDGDITVQSDPESGTVFTLEIPKQKKER